MIPRSLLGLDRTLYWTVLQTVNCSAVHTVYSSTVHTVYSSTVHTVYCSEVHTVNCIIRLHPAHCLYTVIDQSTIRQGWNKWVKSFETSSTKRYWFLDKPGVAGALLQTALTPIIYLTNSSSILYMLSLVQPKRLAWGRNWNWDRISDFKRQY